MVLPNFKKEVKIMVLIFLSIPILAVVAAFAIPKLLTGSSEAYVCIDKGGSYNFDKCECDFKENHEFTREHSCK